MPKVLRKPHYGGICGYFGKALHTLKMLLLPINLKPYRGRQGISDPVRTAVWPQNPGGYLPKTNHENGANSEQQ